jgi:hypothetical protein
MAGEIGTKGDITMNKLSIVISVLALTGFMAMPAIADIEGHQHSAHKKSHVKAGHHQHGIHRHSEPDEMHEHSETEESGMFLIKKEIDGFTVSFHVMGARKAIKHGGTHNFMVKVEKDGKTLTDLTTNSKVTHPNGKSESKMLKKMGDWYMAGYDLGHEGQHQLMVLFKTADGTKHFGGIYYPESK